ncbi:MAG: hypothetical protein LBE62_06670 [Azonexus sp.]|jgi:hypothetical protein|nr:hypothetical protein [Azonexus sp.]
MSVQPRKPRHAGQKIALTLAVISGFLCLPTAGAFVWLWRTRGLIDTWTPSALAAVAFFVCCAGVFYVMSLPPRRLLPEAGDSV